MSCNLLLLGNFFPIMELPVKKPQSFVIEFLCASHTKAKHKEFRSITFPFLPSMPRSLFLILFILFFSARLLPPPTLLSLFCISFIGFLCAFKTFSTVYNNYLLSCVGGCHFQLLSGPFMTKAIDRLAPNINLL